MLRSGPLPGRSWSTQLPPCEPDRYSASWCPLNRNPEVPQLASAPQRQYPAPRSDGHAHLQEDPPLDGTVPPHACSTSVPFCTPFCDVSSARRVWGRPGEKTSDDPTRARVASKSTC